MSNRQDQPHYIQLTAGEDIASVRDRLSFLRGKRVLVIWPESGTALHRKLDLVMLTREARRRAIQVALVTHDDTVINHARDLNISTFETIGASERSRWKRGQTRTFTRRDHRPDQAPEPDDLMDVASRVKNNKRVSRLRMALVRATVLLIVLLALGTAGYVVIPGADIILQPYQDTIRIQTTLTISPDVDDVNVEDGIIPATILRATVQSSGTTETAGVQELDNSPAIGVAVFTNRTGRSVTIPAGTTISTSAASPVLFRTLSQVIVPAGTGQQAEVAIEAASGFTGRVGNVESGMINTVIGDLAESVSVLNLSATTGGESQTYTTVTETDRNQLRSLVRVQLQSAALNEMQQTLTDNQTIVIETIRIPDDGERSDWTTFSHEAGDISDTLSLDMRAIVEAIAIDERFARQVVFAQLSAQKPAGLTLQPETFTYSQGSDIQVQPDGSVTVSASGQAIVSAEVDRAVIQQQIAGLTLADAQQRITQLVRLAPGTQPTITLQPDWTGQLPLLPVRITVDVVTDTLPDSLPDPEATQPATGDTS